MPSVSPAPSAAWPRAWTDTRPWPRCDCYARARAGAAVGAQSRGRLRDRRARWPCRRARLDRRGRAAPCRNRGAGAGRRGGARRHRLCHARALRPSRPDAALRRGAGRGGRRPRGGGGRRSRSARARAAASRACATAGIDVVTGVCGDEAARAECRLLQPRARGPAAGHAEDRAEPRRPHRDRHWRKPMDHRRGRAPLRPSAARPPRRDPGRHRNGAGRRPGADLPPAGAGGPLAAARRAGQPAAVCRDWSKLAAPATRSPTLVFTTAQTEAGRSTPAGSRSSEIGARSRAAGPIWRPC